MIVAVPVTVDATKASYHIKLVGLPLLQTCVPSVSHLPQLTPIALKTEVGVAVATTLRLHKAWLGETLER